MQMERLLRRKAEDARNDWIYEELKTFSPFSLVVSHPGHPFADNHRNRTTRDTKESLPHEQQSVECLADFSLANPSGP